MGIEVSGLKELSAMFERMGKNVEAVQNEAVQAGAEVMKNAIEINTPVGETGELKKWIVKSKIMREKNGSPFIEVGPSKFRGFYGRMLEFGTVKMKAQPFVEPAILEARDETLSAMNKVIKEAIEDVQR